MIGPRSLADALSSGGRYALDVPVAALAGLSVAFLVYAMPGDTLAGLVGSTGLASLVPAAEPPLGLKARIGIGAAGALAVFAAAFLLLRWLDRLGAEPREAPVEAGERGAPETPRLRRRDFHPDAPPRPPIMAVHELGEPAPPELPAELRDEPAPPVVEEEWLLDSPEPAAESAPEPFVFPTSEQEVEPEAESPPATTVDEPAQTEAPSGSLDDLMARLEQGLARRRTAPRPSRPADPVPQPGPASDDRLQSAIDSLQRLAARGD